LTIGSDCGTPLKLHLTEEILDYLASMSGRAGAGARRRNTGGRGGMLRNGLPARYDPTREQYESVHITQPKPEILCRGNPIISKGHVDKKAEGEKYYKKDEFFDHLSSSTQAESLPQTSGTGLSSTMQTLIGIYLHDRGRNQQNSLTFGQPGMPEYTRLLGRGGTWGPRGMQGGLERNGGRWGRGGGRGAGRGGRGGNRQQGGAGGNRQAAGGANNNPQGGGRIRSNNNQQQANNGQQQNQGNRQRSQQGNQQSGQQQSWNQGGQNGQRNNNNNNNGNQGMRGGRKQRGGNRNRTYGRDGEWNSTPLTDEQYNAYKGYPSWMPNPSTSGGMIPGSSTKASGPWTFPTAPTVEASA